MLEFRRVPVPVIKVGDGHRCRKLRLAIQKADLTTTMNGPQSRRQREWVPRVRPRYLVGLTLRFTGGGRKIETASPPELARARRRVQAVVGLLLRGRQTRGTHSGVAPPRERAPTLTTRERLRRLRLLIHIYPHACGGRHDSTRRSYVSGKPACPSYLPITRAPKESDQRCQGHPETHADRN
jgi:hypothetical protein